MSETNERRPVGRPPLSEHEPTVQVSVKLTQSQHAEMVRAGWVAWLRRVLDRRIKQRGA